MTGVRYAVMICIIVCCASLAPGRPDTGPYRAIVAVFDFSHPTDPQIGRDLARRVRSRLARTSNRLEVIDHLTMNDLTSSLSPSLQTTDSQMAAMLTRKAGAAAAVWGELTVTGQTHRLTVRYLDLSAPARNRWCKVFADDTERARGLLARNVTEAITDQTSWAPPQYGDEAEPNRFGKPLNRNGAFDAAGFHPVGWDRVDGISSVLVDHPARRRVLQFNTNLDREAWRKWQHSLRRREGDARRPPKIRQATGKYGNVGAMEGVMLLSEWIDATPGRRYWLTADVHGPGNQSMAPKIFVKGYADFRAQADSLSEVSLHELGLTAGEFARLPKTRRRKLIAADAKAHPDRHRREVYRWYLACRPQEGAAPDAWGHHAAPFPPRGGLPANVKYLRIQIYANWPLGLYLFDNVHLYADPRQATSQPAAKPRTPGAG